MPVFLLIPELQENTNKSRNDTSAIFFNEMTDLLRGVIYA